MREKIIAGAVGICLAASLLAGCGKEEKTAVQPPLVKYQRVANGVGQAGAVYAGTVRGRYETNLAFQVGGQILSRSVQLGDRVTAGQVLMTIDPKDIVQKAQQGDAQAEAARAQLQLAETNLARYQELYKASAIPAAMLDQYQTTYDAALAAWQNAEAQAAQGHNALSYTTLTAGADGVISAVNAEAGQVVAAGQTVMTLVQTGELEVEINVPENRLTEVTLGRPVNVSFWALGKTTSGGLVREVAPMADSVARTYRVRVSLPAPPAGMELGMTASVSLAEAGAARPGTVLPMSAIYQTGDKPQVWVVTGENRVTLKTVTVESFRSNEVLVSGLTEGEAVVTAGVHKLHEGDEVRLGAEASRP